MDFNFSLVFERNIVFENYFVCVNSIGKIEVVLKEIENSIIIYYFLYFLFNEFYEYCYDF